MADNKKDIAIALKYSSQYNVKSKNVAKKMLTSITAKNLMTSPFGQKYVNRLEEISNGVEISKCTCLLCNQYPSVDGIICESCLVRFSGGKLSFYKPSEKQSEMAVNSSSSTASGVTNKVIPQQEEHENVDKSVSETGAESTNDTVAEPTSEATVEATSETMAGAISKNVVESTSEILIERTTTPASMDKLASEKSREELAEDFINSLLGEDAEKASDTESKNSTNDTGVTSDNNNDNDEEVFCKNCGFEITGLSLCPKCNTPKGRGDKYCQCCGNKVKKRSKKIVSNDKLNQEKINEAAIQAKSKLADLTVKGKDNVAKTLNSENANELKAKLDLENKKPLLIGIAVVAIVLIILLLIGLDKIFFVAFLISLGFLVYKFIKKQPKKTAIIATVALLIMYCITAAIYNGFGGGPKNLDPFKIITYDKGKIEKIYGNGKLVNEFMDSYLYEDGFTVTYVKGKADAIEIASPDIKVYGTSIGDGVASIQNRLTSKGYKCTYSSEENGVYVYLYEGNKYIARVWAKQGKTTLIEISKKSK